MSSNSSDRMMDTSLENSQTPTTMDMEKELKILENRYDLIAKEVCLLEKLAAVDQTQRLNHEEKLFGVRKMYEEFGENLVRLREDQELLCKREDRIIERHMKFTSEYRKMVQGKNIEISVLIENINQMEKQIKERGKRIEALEGKIKERDAMIEASEHKLKEQDAVIEAYEKKIRHYDKAAVVRENAHRNLASKVKGLQEEISSFLNFKVGDLANSVPLLKYEGVASPGTHNVDAGNIVATPTVRVVELTFSFNDTTKTDDINVAQSSQRNIEKSGNNNSGVAYPLCGSKRSTPSAVQSEDDLARQPRGRGARKRVVKKPQNLSDYVVE